MEIKSFLQSLVTEKIVDQETSERIYAHFQAVSQKQTIAPPQKKSDNNTLLILIGTIGVILSGIGVIYLFAHNWDHLSRSTKLMLSFAPVVLSILANAFTLIKRRNNRVWEESTAISTFLAVGSMLALLLQIYQLPGVENYFYFIWAALSIPVIYLLRSHVSVFLALFLILMNLTSHPIDQSVFYRLPWFGSLLLFSTLIPYYYRLFLLKRPADIYILQQFALPIVVFCSVIVSMHASEYTIWLISFLTLANFHLFGTSRFARNNTSPSVLAIISYIGVSLSLSYLLFRENWHFEGIFSTQYSDHREVFIPLLTLLGMVQLFFYFRKEKIGWNNMYKWLIFVPFLFIFIDHFTEHSRTIYQFFALGAIALFLETGKKRQHSFTVYPAVSFLAVLVMSFFTFEDHKHALFYGSLIPGLFLISSFSVTDESDKSRFRVELLIVFLIQILMLIIASFEGFWKFRAHVESSQLHFSENLLVIVTIAFIAYQFFRIQPKAMDFLKGVPYGMSILTPALIFLGSSLNFPVFYLITVLLLVGGIVAVIVGAKNANLLITNLGLGLVGITLFCRFLDMQMTLTLKGIIFIAIGLSFFLANYLIVKNKNRNHEQ